MATSGTVGTTRINTAKLIEKAVRRCGLSPASITNETIETAKEDLFMLLMSISSRGRNLWCVDHAYIAIVAGQATYQLPDGGLEVLSLLVETPESDGTYRGMLVSPMNMDDYTAEPNKERQSPSPTSYWFEKLVEPRVTLWPVPNDATKRLSMYYYRQPQDVGQMTDELELPTRWLEAVCWHLALRLAFELPGVQPERAKMIMELASSMTFEVEGSETDSAPTYFAPSIGVYTR